MARFFVGQRVRSVGKIDPGNTGEIVMFDHECDEFNCLVAWDNAGPCDDGSYSAPGDWVWTHTNVLVPILDQHQPADDAEFIRHIGEILERQGVVA